MTCCKLLVLKPVLPAHFIKIGYYLKNSVYLVCLFIRILCPSNGWARSQSKKEVNPMPFQKPLDLLLSGKTQWDKWRRTYPDVQASEPDLHGADLHGVDLHGADLHGADLTDANLQGADLRDANLRDADLRNVNLSNANLSGADLLQARMNWADLRNATLSRTNMHGADLRGADLRGADLEGSIFSKAQFDAKSMFSTTPPATTIVV
jgi:hypothetical protein